MTDEESRRPEDAPPDADGDRAAADRGGGESAAGGKEVGGDAGGRGAGGGSAGDGGDGGGRPRRHPADETLRTGALPEAVECPHCGETESEQFATFGTALSVSQYYCRSCRTVFEFFKWR